MDTSAGIMRSGFWAWVRIMRPLIVFISIFGASVGALNVTLADIPVNAASSVEPVVLAVVLAGSALLAAGLMVHNDYTDLPSDRINRPQKPIPSGLISPNTAKWSGIILMFASVAAAFSTTLFSKGGHSAPLTPLSLNLPCGILTLVIVISGIMYNIRGKYWGIWGHAIVAFGVGAIPLWGAWAVRPFSWYDLKIMLPLALAIFFMEIGREIMVCIGDMRGDREAGFRTTPVRRGREFSMYLVLFFYTLFIPLYPISFRGLFGFPEVFGKFYFVGATVFLLILYSTWINVMYAVRNKDEAEIWHAFELNIRTGTRVGVVLFQVLLFAEVFV